MWGRFPTCGPPAIPTRADLPSPAGLVPNAFSVLFRTHAVDVGRDDRVVSRLLVRCDRRDLRLDALPGAALIDIDVGIGRHRRGVPSVAANDLLVRCPDQRDVSNEGDELVPNVPIHD